MTAPETGALRVSHGFDVLQPRSGPAYPIPCDEWELLKGKLRLISTAPWFYQTIGSALIGAAISTAPTALIVQMTSTQTIIAWAWAAVTFISGALSLSFAHQQRKVNHAQASDVLLQMEIIEKRYDRVSS